MLGEAHYATRTGRAPEPQWLTIPQRGLYASVMILGAIGTGKTSACMYPYVDQLLRWRSDDADRGVGGLVMEVKGDFCRHMAHPYDSELEAYLDAQGVPYRVQRAQGSDRAITRASSRGP